MQGGFDREPLYLNTENELGCWSVMSSDLKKCFLSEWSGRKMSRGKGSVALTLEPASVRLVSSDWEEREEREME